MAAWRENVATLEKTEPLLRLGILANKAAIAISHPFVVVALLAGKPLRLLGGSAHYLTRLVLVPFFGTVLFSSSLWVVAPITRPVLLVVGPLFVALTMVLVALLPDEQDIRDDKSALCELWPLSRRRLQWLREHGTSED